MQQHGGRRPGSGRKPKAPILVRKTLAEQILSDKDEIKLWQELLRTEDERLRLSALVYICNRKHGTPPQSIAVKDTTEPERKPVQPGEYVSAIKAALGFTGALKPLVMNEDSGEPQIHSLPD